MLRRLDIRMSLVAALIALGTGAAVAWACGPFFPNRLLMSGDSAVLWAPVADFRIEIERLRPTNEPAFQAVVPDECEYRASDYARQTADADRLELRAALDALRTPADQRDRLIAQHDALRAALRAHADALARYEPRRPDSAPPRLPDVTIPDGLPPEFTLYLRGAVAYYRDEQNGARDAWRAVLALPPAERRFRSTWAAFMLGKLWLKSDPAQAVECFQQVRALTGDGFADSMGLASSSLGWEANAELKRDHVERAVELYLQQLASGDPTAVWSLRLVAARILKGGDELLRRAARDENARRVVTAYLLARGGPRQSIDDAPPVALTQKWLEMIESAQVMDVAGAERLAWAAYQAGAFATADRWLRLAPTQSGVGHWIRAKLLLRAGKVDEAAAELALAARGFPQDARWEDLNTEFADNYEESGLSPGARALGELGVLRLARRQYVEALDALLRANCWMDAAYVAERVLTLDELLQYVERNWPAVGGDVEAVLRAQCDGLASQDPPTGESALGEGNVRIRHLLARRLTRAERWSEARAYFPTSCHMDFDAYVQNLRLSRERARANTERARALWQAARLCRYRGMELLGTELEPDWYAAYGGDFELPTVSQVRGARGKQKLTASTADERARANRSGVTPSQRWHYRYLAADWAWQAAEWLPDQSDETARVLCEAGSWLKGRDPQAVQRFYKALVRRCGKTELGREAARLRWFPPLPRESANE